MTPQWTTLASAFSIALVGSAILPKHIEPDNTGVPTVDRSTVEIYEAYFPSPQVDATNGIAPRIQRDPFAQPALLTVADPASPLQRKLAEARKANQTQQAHKTVIGNARTTSSSTPSATTGITRHRGSW